MKKIKILAALMALLLCVSMLLTACGNKNKTEEPIPDATDEVEGNEGEGEDSEDADSDAPVDKGDAEAEDTDKLPTVKLADIMNKSWSTTKAQKISNIEKISYEGTIKDSNHRFFVTKQSTNDSDKNVICVYDKNNTSKVLTLNDNRETTNGVTTTTKHYVMPIDDANYFAVIAMKYVNSDGPLSPYNSGTNDITLRGYETFKFYAFEKNNSTSYTEYTITVYGAEMKVEKTVAPADVKKMCLNDVKNIDDAYNSIVKSYIPESYTAYKGTDLAHSGTKVYRTDGKTYTEVKNYGITKLPANLTQAGEYYFTDEESVYTVYDKALTAVLTYGLPNYSSESIVRLLTNGSLLVQYSVALDDKAADYDYMSAGKKYDLVTLIVTKDGATDIADVDYKIDEFKASVAVDGQKMYVDTVENIALIYPIESKLLNTNIANVKLVTISNDLKTVTEVVADGEKPINFPEAISDDCFRVEVLGGNYAVYSESGDKGSVDTDYANYEGKYVIDKVETIYDLKGTVLTKYESYYKLGNSLLVITRDDLGALTYNVLGADGKLVKKENFYTYIAALGCYVTLTEETVKVGGVDTKVDRYTYYNESGTKVFQNDGSFINLNNGGVYYNGDGFSIFEFNSTLYKLTYTK